MEHYFLQHRMRSPALVIESAILPAVVHELPFGKGTSSGAHHRRQ